MHVRTEPCSCGEGWGGVCGCYVPWPPPALPPHASSFNESPVNNTLQGDRLNNAVTQERVVLEQSSAVLPPTPAPLAFLLSALSVSVSSLRDKTFCKSPFFGGRAHTKMAACLIL